eukprot:gene14327-biopygen20096
MPVPRPRHARAMPAPRPRHPTPGNASGLRYARAMPAPRSRQCPVPPVLCPPPGGGREQSPMAARPARRCRRLGARLPRHAPAGAGSGSGQSPEALATAPGISRIPVREHGTGAGVARAMGRASLLAWVARACPAAPNGRNGTARVRSASGPRPFPFGLYRAARARSASGLRPLSFLPGGVGGGGRSRYTERDFVADFGKAEGARR